MKNKRRIRAITLVSLLFNWFSVFMFVKTRTMPLFWIVLFIGTWFRVTAFLYANSMMLTILTRRNGKEVGEAIRMKRIKLFVQGNLAWLCSVLAIISFVEYQFNNKSFTILMIFVIAAVVIINFCNEQNDSLLKFLKGIFSKQQA